MTTISVIIPAYNAQRTILETIESVRQQTFQDIEIIVINDGSTDQTSSIINSIYDSRIQFYDYPNGGPSIARNRGITHANGKYISFIDADDLWTPDKLEKQLAALKTNQKAGVAYSWVAVMPEKKDVSDSEELSLFSGNKATFMGDVYSELLLENFIGNGSNILARDEAIAFVGEFDPNLQPSEDWDYYIRLAAKYHFALVPEHQILYRKTEGTLSTNVSVMETSGLKVIDQAYRIAPKKLQSQKSQSIAIFYLYCCQTYLDNCFDSEDIIKAKQKLLKAIQADSKILFSRYTYILLLRLIRKRLPKKHMLNRLVSTIKKTFKIGLIK